MSAPSTPVKRNLSAPSTPTGSWRHPAVQQIARRRAARSFTSASVFRLVVNSALLFSSFLVVDTVSTRIHFPTPHTTPASLFLQLLTLALWSARLLFLYNIFHSLRPLFSQPDDFSDLALTPDQRKLLGLNPDTPLSPNVKVTDFITPPRYQKSTPPSRSNSPRVSITSPGASTSSFTHSTISNPSSSSPTNNNNTNNQAFTSSLLTSPRSSLLSPSSNPWETPRLRPSTSSFTAASGSGNLFRPLGRIPNLAPVTPGSSIAAKLTDGGEGLFVGANLNRWAYEKSVLQRRSDGIRSPSKGYGLFSPR
ncbi:hypothetical protein EX30DRAFT_344347 [Ascodesmis nigricans]|uniref:Nuclear pore complex component n=1 Tax=Ascodesmis nigricans TaxID=341454 RepID=A0A4S2MK11_9PEZI|nr:hypothetical protein EX30DRAFT_344347 [Ascodesmis nigricans]